MLFFDADDKRLLAALRMGNKDAFAYIYLTYHNKLCKYAYSMSDNAHLAEDCVQDVFLKLWSSRESLEIQTSLNAYLYRCVHNAFLDGWRKDSRKKSLIEELRLETVMELEEQMQRTEDERIPHLMNAIEKLPEKQKQIFILNKLKNYRYKEIAEMKNISERTVEGQIRKAMITLRKEMIRLGVDKIFLLIILIENPFVFLEILFR